MKKLLFICFFICINMNLFAQNYDYGLSQNDINLLLGYFVPNIQALKRNGREWSFSWGKQIAIDTNGDFVMIDYNTSVKWNLGEYNKHLLINDSGRLYFLITNIEKVSTNKFKLSVSSTQYFQTMGFEDEGYIIITFLDNTHITIDKTNFKMGLFNYKVVLLKTVGPDVLVSGTKIR
jgi:hypothetical protein